MGLFSDLFHNQILSLLQLPFQVFFFMLKTCDDLKCYAEAKTKPCFSVHVQCVSCDISVSILLEFCLFEDRKTSLKKIFLGFFSLDYCCSLVFCFGCFSQWKQIHLILKRKAQRKPAPCAGSPEN